MYLFCTYTKCRRVVSSRVIDVLLSPSLCHLRLVKLCAGVLCCFAQGFGAVLTDVSDEGDCTTCGSRLQKNDLGPMDRMQMRSAIMRVAALRSARQVSD